MEPISLGFVGLAFLAGVVMFLAPCTLPLVPAYLALISGVSEEDLEDPARAKRARRSIRQNGIAFVLGFSIVLILFGTIAGVLGSLFIDVREWLVRISGAIIILFGISMLGVFRLPIFSFLFSARSLTIPRFARAGHPTSSLTIGALFAFGWTPCVGPVLGAILLVASSYGSLALGAFLLGVFSLGLSLPFLLLAFLYGEMTHLIKKSEKVLSVMGYVGGGFLIFVGILLLTNNFALLITYGFGLFDAFNYDAILRFL